MPLRRPHTSQPDLLLENQPALDNEYFLDNGNHRCVAFLANRWNGINWPANRSPLDLDFLVRNSFINQMVVIDGPDIYPEFPLDCPPLNRQVFGVQWNNKVAGV